MGDITASGNITATGGIISNYGITSEGDIQANKNVWAQAMYATNRITAGGSNYYTDYKLSVFGKARGDAWEVNSDRNAKENIIEKSDVTAIDGIKSLRFYSYDYKPHEESKNSEAESTVETVQAVQLNASATVEAEESEKTPVHVELGIMTDEAPAEILGEDGKSINLYAYTSYVAKAVQELTGQVEELKKKIEILEAENKALKA